MLDRVGRQAGAAVRRLSNWNGAVPVTWQEAWGEVAHPGLAVAKVLSELLGMATWS